MDHSHSTSLSPHRSSQVGLLSPALSSPTLPEPINSPLELSQPAIGLDSDSPHHNRPISPPIQLPPTPPARSSLLSNQPLPLSSPNEHPFLLQNPPSDQNHYFSNALRSRLRRAWTASRPSPGDRPSSGHHPRHSDSAPGREPSFPTSSFARRLLAVARFASDADRHASVEQMNEDVEAGGDRSQAVNRLRQRMNDLRPDHSTQPHHHQAHFQHSPEPDFGTRNLVGTLHQIRSQRHSYPKYASRDTYLLYCGSHTHVGCGRLLTPRATPLATTRLGSTDEGGGEGELLASDSLPVPGAVDWVDSQTQDSLERELGDTRSQCRCERRFLGCLTCGNTVGHSLSLRCQHCRDDAAVFRYRYHQASLIALPRHTGLPVALTLAAVPPTRPVQPVMSWTEALRVLMDDFDAGLVGMAPDQRGVVAPGTARRGFSTAVRSAIARGMTTDSGASPAHGRHARLGRSDAMRASVRRPRVRGSSIPDGRDISPPLMLREYATALGRVPAHEGRRMSVEVKEEEAEEEGLGVAGSGLGRRRMDSGEQEGDSDDPVGGGRRMRRRIEERGADEAGGAVRGGGGEQRGTFVWTGEVCAR